MFQPNEKYIFVFCQHYVLELRVSYLATPFISIKQTRCVSIFNADKLHFLIKDYSVEGI